MDAPSTGRKMFSGLAPSARTPACRVSLPQSTMAPMPTQPTALPPIPHPDQRTYPRRAGRALVGPFLLVRFHQQQLELQGPERQCLCRRLIHLRGNREPLRHLHRRGRGSAHRAAIREPIVRRRHRYRAIALLQHPDAEYPRDRGLRQCQSFPHQHRERRPARRSVPSLSDIATANASASRHGFLPKLPNDNTKCLLGDGTYGACTAAATANDLSAAVGCQAAGGNGAAYSCSLSPAPPAYVAGANYRLKADVANTGAATVNFNS